jgi:hypothetical protein
MTEPEFKQWFAGFVEGIEGKTPNAKQWAKIQERVSEITGTPVVEKYFYDRYWRPYYSDRTWYGVHGTGVALLNESTAKGADASYRNPLSYSESGAAEWMGTAKDISEGMGVTADAVSYEPAFDSAAAMYALGRADAEAR